MPGAGAPPVDTCSLGDRPVVRGGDEDSKLSRKAIRDGTHYPAGVDEETKRKLRTQLQQNEGSESKALCSAEQ